MCPGLMFTVVMRPVWGARERKPMSTISVARAAIRKALRENRIVRDHSAAHRVAIKAIAAQCKNAQIASDLAWEAVKDVLLGE